MHDILVIITTIFATLIGVIYFPWKVQWLTLNQRAHNWFFKRGIVDYDRYRRASDAEDLYYREKMQLRQEFQYLVKAMTRSTVDVSHSMAASSYKQEIHYPSGDTIGILHFEPFTVKCGMPPFSRNTITADIVKETVVRMFAEAGREYAERIVGDSNARYKG